MKAARSGSTVDTRRDAWLHARGQYPGLEYTAGSKDALEVLAVGEGLASLREASTGLHAEGRDSCWQRQGSARVALACRGI